MSEFAEKRIIVGHGAMLGMAMAAASAAMLGGPSRGNPTYPARLRKPKRRRQQQDRSRKQYLLKGVRP